jgi:hypothetical protein
MGLYQDLCMLKANGELFDYEDLSYENLQDSFLDIEDNDGIIEELFYVRKLRSKILYKPKKLGRTIKNAIIDDFLLGRSDKARKKNLQVKEEILKNENLNMMSKAITHFVFQNGRSKECWLAAIDSFPNPICGFSTDLWATDYLMSLS